ncbi:helix-turn-helix domain-containing protein [Streptomyces sp. GC420]|uniref:helix-turn-helix domain-containing protein n=1 Tax=Streptomyces sp. GC420 TaxID=2697568 RepID=UPI0028BF20B3|nr:helix-turn-helix domain-containing protein [Streptomyces sp. GC420]
MRSDALLTDDPATPQAAAREAAAQEAAARAVDARLAARLGELRGACGWSLDELARRSGVSRSTLSRLERGEISPTAALLGRLCPVYGLTMSRLLGEVEAEPAQLVRAGEQSVWKDEDSGFVRRSVSPPHPGLRAEVVEGTLRPGAVIAYDAPPVPGMEQHIWVLEGAVEVTVQGARHLLAAGDALRFRLWGETRFHCPGPEPVRYAVVVVLP